MRTTHPHLNPTSGLIIIGYCNPADSLNVSTHPFISSSVPTQCDNGICDGGSFLRRSRLLVGNSPQYSQIGLVSVGRVSDLILTDLINQKNHTGMYCNQVGINSARNHLDHRL